MKVLYYSTLPFTDCDFPLIREFQNQRVRCKYMVSLPCTKLSGALFKINKQKNKSAILNCKEYAEFKAYKDYLDLSDVFIVNRTKRGIHPLNIILYIRLIFFILRFNPDVIHVTHPLWGPELLLYLFAHKMVLTVHDPFLHSGEGDKTEHRARKLAFLLCKKLVLLNDKQKDEFISKYRIDNKKIFINKLGIYDCLRVSLNKKKSLCQDCNYILMFGRISPYKGIDILCEAMQIVKKQCPNVRCLIVGSGKMYFDFSLYYNDKNIKLINRYIPTDELVGLIEGSLFTVCPYKDATQSGVVYSSFALHKPVVASNVGALGDAVKNGVTGLLVQPNTPIDLAKAIIKMIKMPSMVSSMEKNIKDFYEKGNNSWTSITNKYISIYNA